MTKRPVPPFVAATLIPAALLVVGSFLGGFIVLIALLCLTVVPMVMDRMFTTAGAPATPGVVFPDANKLSDGLAIAHILLLPLAIAAVAGYTGLGFWGGMCALLAFGIYLGQVSLSNAANLIHSPDKRQQMFGKWIMISLFAGHYVTAHRHVHDQFVGTPDDPSTPIMGENFYSFLTRAWPGAFETGWEIERSIAEMKGDTLPDWRHPYVTYAAGAFGILVFVAIVFGFGGILSYLMLLVAVHLQIVLRDYVYHYGLRRRILDDDTFEPIAPWLAWNSAHWVSSGLTLNMTRHSAHHMDPSRNFAERALPDHMEGPRMPHSPVTMGFLALVPPIWADMMDKRAVAWQERIDEGKIPLKRLPLPLSAETGKPSRKERAEAPAQPESEIEAVAARVSAKMATDTPEAEAKPEEAPTPPPDPQPAPSDEADDPLRALREDLTADDTAAIAKADTPAEEDLADASGTATSKLWSDDADDTGVAPSQEAQRSHMPAEEGTDEAPAEETSAPGSPVEAAIADVVAGSRKDGRRQRAKFPDLEPDGGEQPVRKKGSLRGAVRGAAFAAKGLATVLYGAPPRPPRQ